MRDHVALIREEEDMYSGWQLFRFVNQSHVSLMANVCDRVSGNTYWNIVFVYCVLPGSKPMLTHANTPLQ